MNFIVRVLAARALWHWHPLRDTKPVRRSAGFRRLTRYALVFDAITFLLLALAGPSLTWALGSLLAACALAITARVRRAR